MLHSIIVLFAPVLFVAFIIVWFVSFTKVCEWVGIIPAGFMDDFIKEHEASRRS